MEQSSNSTLDARPAVVGLLEQYRDLIKQQPMHEARTIEILNAAARILVGQPELLSPESGPALAGLATQWPGQVALLVDKGMYHVAAQQPDPKAGDGRMIWVNLSGLHADQTLAIQEALGHGGPAQA